ncbi:hypothetical protein HELRODRAFT_176177 [Helobdella robusta]|uniref:Uncharacterized protein n=1 Tax=Helobdella robusta TaxID=6412 RepID=T1FA91_HELRO|nr:hypothetical protein HELRODRAFT_176177 [Helobdella robusta]ESO00306.1 hypothetical protein HELRODRAFT_176177 [Helobdella robusta]
MPCRFLCFKTPETKSNFVLIRKGVKRLKRATGFTSQGCAKADRLTDRPSENRPLVVRKPIRLDGPVKTGQGCAKADRLTDRPSENRPLVVRKPIRLDGPVKTGQGCAKADRLTDRPSENRPWVL